jgi:multidrug efflux pump subunit AcrA (membrane-fusion protein)
LGKDFIRVTFMQRNRLPMWVISLLLMFPLIFFTGCSAFSPSENSDIVSMGQEVKTAKNVITATGTVLPKKQALLRFKQDAFDIRILVKPGDTVEAGEELVSSSAFHLEKALGEAEAQLTRAEAAYDGLLREEFREVRQPEKNAAFEDIEAAQAQVDLAEANLAASSIVAPFDGTVIEIYPNSFENVKASQPVVLFADLNTLRIRTDDLDEKDAGRLTLGDSAEIFFDALPDVVIQGRITDISHIVQEGAGIDFNVVVTPMEKPQGLRWGMSAYVVIKPGSPIAPTAGPTDSESGGSSDADMASSQAGEKRLCDEAYFVNETIRDGARFTPGALINKTWVFRNTGTCTWRPDYQLLFTGGDRMSGPESLPLGRYVAPGANVIIALDLTAPADEGSYYGSWQLQNELGQKLYDVWVDISVAR